VVAELRIGTSGWNYRAWRGSFFPDDLTAKEWLPFYASRFNSVEVNYSFYRLPSEQICDNWYRATPDDFRFAVKASRYLTHIKRLAEANAAWDTFVERVSRLKHKLGPVLLQFPATFLATERNLHSLESFLGYARMKTPQVRIAVEFRDESCFGAPMLKLLDQYRASIVLSHSSRYPVPELIPTSDFAYFRFHGPREMFASSYTDWELEKWADVAAATLSNRTVYAYFNNDSGGHAPRNALTLRQKIEARLNRA